jgi:hypothetical protein
LVEWLIVVECGITWYNVVQGGTEMKADKGEFDTVLGRMLAQPPKKNAEIRVKKKARAVKPKPSQK